MSTSRVNRRLSCADITRGFKYACSGAAIGTILGICKVFTSMGITGAVGHSYDSVASRYIDQHISDYDACNFSYQGLVCGAEWAKKALVNAADVYARSQLGKDYTLYGVLLASDIVTWGIAGLLVGVGYDSIKSYPQVASVEKQEPLPLKIIITPPQPSESKRDDSYQLMSESAAVSTPRRLR